MSADILDRLRARSVRTHWRGCADQHDLCAAIEEIERLRRDRDKNQREMLRAIDALRFYADPGTYFAIAFIGDPPCGEILDDCSDTEFDVKPGRMARETLESIEKAFEQDETPVTIARRIDIAATMHHASQGEGCPICKTDERCRTRAVLEGE